MILRQTIRRVRVDVVATDAQGRPVTGLRASDFSVAEDGKPQSIREFEYHADESLDTQPLNLPQLPPHTFMNLPSVAERGPLTIVLYDILNTPLSDQLDARRQLVDFLKESAGRRIAIFVLGNRLRLLQGFTSDTELLLAAANQTAGSSTLGYQAELTGYPASRPASPASPVDAQSASGASGRSTDEQAFERRSAGLAENGREAQAGLLLDDRIGMTLDALTQIGKFLAPFPGRKNLIWYSGSFPAGILPNPVDEIASFQNGSLVRNDQSANYTDRIRAATNLLSSAEVAVYPVDARGLLSGDITLNEKSAEYGSMDEIGLQTGGRAFYSTNRLDEALKSAADDGSSYYSLLYEPTNMKFDGKLRRISVEISRGHYHLAYRRSYFAGDATSKAHNRRGGDEESAGTDSTAADPMMAATQFGSPLSYQLVMVLHLDAMGAPAPATEVQMAALEPYRKRLAEVEHREYVAAKTPVTMQRYSVRYGLLAKLLDLPKTANGFYHSDISIDTLAFDADGATLWGTETRLKDEYPPSKIDEIRNQGFQAAQTIVVPLDTAVLRFVVRDEFSGRIGSMEIRLPLSADGQRPVTH